MASNPIKVNSQMQQLADKAVAAARDKFGVSLDFSENSLQQLDTLLYVPIYDYLLFAQMYQ